MSDPKPCTHCEQRPGRPLSFDLDLPTVWWCDLCAYAIVMDRELFDDLGRGKRKARRRAS